ncbi:NUDIX domain-containing protein [Curvibacter sp. HBC61]|uniref:NUDIX domain-containing protein n=1 Tax=Curvibacter cyanobacteriorum TaxID=3026422 RepID=A0ABT5N2N1_9BURK|nr:NUDIX domain-containing protein [Curvibacter sp. HBC61]MDD0840567.1 NUDIX domain-containing protein [Curvibacter sp. HBC61]
MRTPAWLTRARAAAQQAPRQPRLPVQVAGLTIGSVEDEVLTFVADLAPHLPLQREDTPRGPVWQLDCAPEDITSSLNELALALRDAQLCGPWRDEQLGVLGPAARRLGTIERGAVRVLGLATQAVHLVGWAPDGRMWVQQRALNKPNDPGLWDTLMGGMVSAEDDVSQALARETWEEAGLRLDQLSDLVHGGHVNFRRPSTEAGGAGYMIERIDWYQATLPEGVQPSNQDGEVAQFELVSREDLLARLKAGQFTLEASLIAAEALGL